jgi:AcrR family transcriptional regulator
VTTVNPNPSPNPYRRSLLRRERSLDTRRKLVRAAARLWSEKGYDSTTVEEICAAAGVGRTTYYLYFDSKERLLVELTLATASGVAADVEAALGAGTVDEQLRAFVDGLVRRMESVPKSLAALVMGHVAPRAVQSRPAKGGAVLFDDILADIMREAQRRGEIRADVDTREIGDVLGGMTMDALQRWAGDSSARSLRDRLQLRIDLVLDAIRTRPSSALRRRDPAGPASRRR